MERIKTKRINPEIENLRVRVSNAVGKLPRGWKNKFFEKHPEFDNNKGIALLNRVIYLTSTDIAITEKIEELVEDLAN